MDKLVGNIGIDEAAAIASEYRDRKQEILNLPGEGDTTMDTGAISVIQNNVENEMDTDRGDDSKEAEKTDGISP